MASIVTITQLSRHVCLQNLCEMVKAQTYPILEWVIVEGSREEDAAQNAIHIANLKNDKIKYIEYSGKALSDLRNAGNNACTGEVIVCMDDDDYYPPTRVEHAVKSLADSKKDIAGCSAMYLYDYNLKQLYKFRKFGDNHSTNNCMAFTRRYLNDHAHASGLNRGEEPSFTNGFTAPMVQLNANKCIVVSSHMTNTVDKRQMCEDSTAGRIKHLRCVQKNVLELIPVEMFERMQN